MITVYYKGSGLLLSKIVAERFNLKNGQTIYSERLFWEVLGANAEHGIMTCKAAIWAENNQN